MDENQGEIIIYQTDNGGVNVNVQLEGETAWLTQAAMAELFDVAVQNITMHLQNIYAENELSEMATCKEFLQVQKEGNREVSRKRKFYNLDAIIAVGYRVNSKRATSFRIWATSILKEYMIKGFAMNDERLKQSGGGQYWKELLERIRDIRSSEKVLYRQVLDLYAESIDYDKNSEESLKFFKIVQNKLHYAAHGHTASEVIFERIDADKPFLGLENFKGSLPTKREAQTAKNFLTETELKILRNLVSGYFDFAEIQAERHNPMRMKDYIAHLDKILSATGEKILKDGGKISHETAMKKVDAEYKKYQQKTITPVEEAYLETLKAAQKKITKKGKKK